GRPPYQGPLSVVMGQILAAPVPSAREFRPDVDGRLDAACRRAMAKDPGERFASMAAFAKALDDYLDGPRKASSTAVQGAWATPTGDAISHEVPTTRQSRRDRPSDSLPQARPDLLR